MSDGWDALNIVYRKPVKREDDIRSAISMVDGCVADKHLVDSNEQVANICGCSTDNCVGLVDNSKVNNMDDRRRFVEYSNSLTDNLAFDRRNVIEESNCDCRFYLDSNGTGASYSGPEPAIQNMISLFELLEADFHLLNKSHPHCPRSVCLVFH